MSDAVATLGWNIVETSHCRLVCRTEKKPNPPFVTAPTREIVTMSFADAPPQTVIVEVQSRLHYPRALSGIVAPDKGRHKINYDNVERLLRGLAPHDPEPTGLGPSSAGGNAASVTPIEELQWSPDRTTWWNGSRWVDVAVEVPPGCILSDDRRQWWDGLTWRVVQPDASRRIRGSHE